MKILITNKFLDIKLKWQSQKITWTLIVSFWELKFLFSVAHWHKYNCYQSVQLKADEAIKKNTCLYLQALYYLSLYPQFSAFLLVNANESTGVVVLALGAQSAQLFPIDRFRSHDVYIATFHCLFLSYKFTRQLYWCWRAR